MAIFRYCVRDRVGYDPSFISIVLSCGNLEIRLLSNSCGLRFVGTRFWVIHRRRQYGPFDYEWSKDFNGIEMLYRGDKFGEYCSSEEIYADLKEFGLPMSVVEVTSIAIGSILYGLLNGLSSDEKQSLLVFRLCEHGYEKFSQQIERKPDAA